MPSRSVARTIAVVLACVVIGLIAAFTQYVHRGYVGVVDGSDPLRLLDRGLHIRSPWKHVVFYPVNGGSVGITTVRQGPRGTLRAEVTLVMSVCRDSVESLHKAYEGEYIEALVVPCVNRFFEIHGDAWADWRSSPVVNTIDEEMAVYLNTSLTPHGVNIFQAWFVSFEVDAGALEQTDWIEPGTCLLCRSCERRCHCYQVCTHLS